MHVSMSSMDGVWFKLGWPVGINSWKALFEIQALLNAMWKVMQVLLCLVAVVSGLRPEFLCCKTWIPVGQGIGPQFMHAHC